MLEMFGSNGGKNPPAKIWFWTLRIRKGRNLQQTWRIVRDRADTKCSKRKRRWYETAWICMNLHGFAYGYNGYVGGVKELKH
jgi:hypothetical protein